MAELPKEDVKPILRSTSSTAAPEGTTVKSSLVPESSSIHSLRSNQALLDGGAENQVAGDNGQTNGFEVVDGGLIPADEKLTIEGLELHEDCEPESEDPVTLDRSLPFQVQVIESSTERQPVQPRAQDTEEVEEEITAEEEAEEEEITAEEEEDIDVVDPQLGLEVAKTLQSNVYNIYKKGALYDFIVKVEDREFKCHRIILAAMSGYFQSLLLSEMKETSDGSVTLEAISAETFARVLRLIYGGNDVVTSSGMVENLLKAAVFLQIDVLENQCVRFLDRDMDVENVVGIWRLSQAYNLQSLIKKSWHLITSQFDSVSRCDEINTLPKPDLIQILMCEHLKVSSEDIICDAVLRWIKYDLPARESELPHLFQFVCLPKVSGTYLFDTLFSDELMQRNATFFQLVQEALCYHLKPDKRDEILSRQPILRSNSDIHKVVLLFGGYVIQEQTLQSVVCYDLRNQKWFTLASIPYDPGVDFASCCLNNEVYISGGSRSMDKCVKYCPVENQWYLQPSLITGRECHVMVAVGDILYVLGGSSSALQRGTKLPTAVECYNTKSGRWSSAGHLQICVESLSAVVVGETIFTFGGCGDDSKPSSVIQSFDTHSRTSTIYGSLHSPVHHTMAFAMSLPNPVLHSMASTTSLLSPVRHSMADNMSLPSSIHHSMAGNIQSNIYIVCPDGHVLEFSVKEKTVRKILQITDMNQTGFGIYIHENKLMVIGGEKPDGTLSDRIIIVDLKKRSSKVIFETLPIPMAMFHMQMIKLPARLLIQRGFNIMSQGSGFNFESD